jgi:hypothetical protein
VRPPQRFEEACIALQVYAGDEKGREIIATRIIDLARGGLIDPNALDIASIATGPKAVLSVKCFRMGMNIPDWGAAISRTLAT